MDPEHIRPLKGLCLVELLPHLPEEHASPLVLPDIARREREQAVVLRIGAWPTNKKGLAVLPNFTIGSRVIVASESGTTLREGTRIFKIVHQDHIRAIISESAA